MSWNIGLDITSCENMEQPRVHPTVPSEYEYPTWTPHLEQRSIAVYSTKDENFSYRFSRTGNVYQTLRGHPSKQY